MFSPFPRSGGIESRCCAFAIAVEDDSSKNQSTCSEHSARTSVEPRNSLGINCKRRSKFSLSNVRNALRRSIEGRIMMYCGHRIIVASSFTTTPLLILVSMLLSAQVAGATLRVSQPEQFPRFYASCRTRYSAAASGM